MLLLDAPKKRIVNDAARAKDRVVDLDIKAVTPETLTELLGLPGMRVERFAVEEQEGQEYLHLFCEHCHEVAICRIISVNRGAGGVRAASPPAHPPSSPTY